MLKNGRWYIVFAVLFFAFGMFILVRGRPLDAAWAFVLGAGNVFGFYAQKQPELNRGPLAWGIAIVFIIVLVAIALLRFAP